MAANDDSSGTVFTRAQARAGGLSDRQIDRQLASGTLTAARRGVLCPSNPDQDSSTEPGGHTEPGTALTDVPLQIKAAQLASPSRELVVSHTSAARLWGLPSPLGGWPLPEFTAASGTTRRRRGLHVRVAELLDDDLVEQLGTTVTSPARTVADCLRSLPGRDGLAMADAALRRNLVTESAVLEVLHRQSGWPGVSVARQVFKLADRHRESPLESWSAWAFAHTGVPAPDWQMNVRDADGRRLGRVDCWWALGAVVGEADGRAKYALATAERGGSAEALLDVLQAERRREQRLRAVGADVIRWSADDVLDSTAAQALAQRILAAISLGRRSARFTGVVAPVMRPVATEKPGE